MLGWFRDRASGQEFQKFADEYRILPIAEYITNQQPACLFIRNRRNHVTKRGQQQERHPVPIKILSVAQRWKSLNSPSTTPQTCHKFLSTQTQNMDRGTPTLRNHVQNCSKMHVRQARRGWLQECLCCDSESEFKYFIEGTHVADSVEESTHLCRCCFAPHHPFIMEVKDVDTESQLIEVDRPFRCCLFPCKCCCQQEAIVMSGTEKLGQIRETWWWCVPQFKVHDHDENVVYIVHPPTCFGGACINCFTEGNPCTHGCCKLPFRVYAPNTPTHDESPPVGVIFKIPKTAFVEVFTEANVFEIDFPQDSTFSQKGLLVGSSLLLNSLFFEGSEWKKWASVTLLINGWLLLDVTSFIPLGRRLVIFLLLPRIERVVHRDKLGYKSCVWGFAISFHLLAHVVAVHFAHKHIGRSLQIT